MDALARQMEEYIRPVMEQRRLEAKAREKAKRIQRNKERVAQDSREMTEEELKKWTAKLDAEKKSTVFNLRSAARRGVRDGRIGKKTARGRQRARINVENLVIGIEKQEEMPEGGTVGDMYADDVMIDPEVFGGHDRMME